MALIRPPAWVVPLQQRWFAMPGNVRGAVWVMVAAVWLTGMAVTIKVLGKTMSPWQIVLLRCGAARSEKGSCWFGQSGRRWPAVRTSGGVLKRLEW